jgi:hypothetical protein
VSSSTRTTAAQVNALRAGPYAGRGGLQALAQAVGVTVGTLKRWRTQEHAPTWEHRRALADLHAAHLQALATDAPHADADATGGPTP